MKFFAIICCVGLTQAFLVRREADAEPEADADADAGYGGYIGGAVSAPVCKSVPVKTCNPRQVEAPRKVCHQEYDEIVDTVITQHCEEVITTTCTQSSTQSRHSSGIVGQDSKVVATGVIASHEVTVAHGPATGVVAGYGAVGHGVLAGGAIAHGAVVSSGYGKREAEADAEADADAEAGGYGYAAVSPVASSAPVCSSVPVKQCKDVPISTPRRVGKTVCKVVTDITTIEDCQETITTECTQVSQKTAHHSAVVGHDTKVGPSAVVATHGTVAHGVVAGYGAVGGVVAHGAVAGAPVVAGYASTGYGLAGQW